MEKLFSILPQKIATKFMLISILISFVFVLLTIVTWGSFQNIEGLLTKIVVKEFTQVLDNAKSGRELGRIVSDATLLENTFFGKDNLLKTEGARLVKGISILEAKAADPQLKEPLRGYKHKLQQVIEQYAVINGLYLEIQSIQQHLAISLALLEELVTDKMITQVLQGENTSIIEQVTELVAGYRETLLEIHILFSELGLDYFKNPETNQKNPMIPLIDYLLLRLRPLSASEPEIAKYGLEIMTNVTKYKKLIFKFHHASVELQARLDEASLKKERILFHLEKKDGYFSATAKNMRESIIEIIENSGKFLIILSSAIIIFLGFITYFFIVSIIHKPIEKILKGIEAIKSGDLDTKIQLNRRDEWNSIEISLNEMVSQRKQAEKALFESEKKYKEFVEETEDIVTSLDRDGNFLFVNLMSEKIFGINSKDIIGMHAFDFVHSDDQENTQIWFNDCLEKKILKSSYENKQINKTTGKVFNMLWTCNFIYDKKGQISRIDSIAHNITVRRHAEKELQASYERFYTVLDSIDATVYVSDMETYEILFMNKYMIECFGRNMTGEICWDAFRGGSGPCANCSNDLLIDKNGIPTGVYTWQNKNPVTNKWYNNYDRAINWTDGRLVRLQIATDITGFKKMEAQLQQAQKMESIGTLAGGIAHDFNNILFPIVGHSEMLLKDIPEDSQFRDGLNQIYSSALRASKLVKQILTFSRQDSGDVKLMKIQPIIKEALKLIRSTIPTTIEIRQNLQSDCGAIKADPTQIHQIVMNLATNAYHAMEETGGKLNIKLKKVGLEELDLFDPDMKPGAYACLSISDTGKGMDSELIGKIFDPFFTTKKKGKGTGMGLSVVHGIIKNMNGTITVYSEPDKGAEFNVYLPISEAVKEQQVTNTTTVIQGGSEHILLVDDEKAIIDMEQKMLERFGYEVTSYSSSLDALEAFRTAPDKFDLVITDMQMPNMSGDKLSVELNKILPGIPILLCTGFSEVMSEEKAVTMGVNGFLLKPIVIKDLFHKIREVLDSN